MNIWRRGSLTQNPYTRTAFRVARVPHEIVRHKTIAQLIGQTKRIVGTDPQAHTIGGKPVTVAEINAAEQILLDPKQRIVEELLAHAAEQPPLEQIRKLAQEVASIMATEETKPLPVTNLSGLQTWAQVLVRDFLHSVPAPDPSFGALEMELVPPFGKPEEE